MSNIEWTGKTWNPVAGCEAVSPGCANCYAARMTRRLEAMGQKDYAGLTTDKHFNGVVRPLPHKLDIPLRRKKPTTWFVNSMSDLFHPSVPPTFIIKVWSVMDATPQHTYQILTKHAKRMAGLLSEIIVDVLPNVWLGVTAENQKYADDRLYNLLESPAAVHFVSYEPALGPVDFYPWIFSTDGFVSTRNDGPVHRDDDGVALDWVIAGGESGPGKRPYDLQWFRDVRDQCRESGVAFFMKQLDKVAEIPDDLMIRQTPQQASVEL